MSGRNVQLKMCDLRTLKLQLQPISDQGDEFGILMPICSKIVAKYRVSQAFIGSFIGINPFGF